MKPAVPWWKTILLGSLEFGLLAAVIFNSSLLLPNQILTIVGEQGKSATLGIITGIGGAFSTLLAPITGYLSDRVMYKQRIPFLIGGTLFYCGITFARAFMNIHSEEHKYILVALYGTLAVLANISFTVANTPYMAMIPDLYNKDMYGKVAGLVVGMGLIGSLVSVAVLGAIYRLLPLPAICALNCVFPLVGLVIVCTLFWNDDGIVSYIQEEEETNLLPEKAETKQDEEPPMQVSCCTRIGLGLKDFVVSMITPLTNCNFLLACCSTFCAMMGIGFIQGFGLYVIRDLIHPHYDFFSWQTPIHTPEQAQAVLTLITFSLAIVMSIASGPLSSCMPNGRKILMAVGALLFCIYVAVQYIFKNFASMIIANAIFGLSFGIMFSNTVALGNEVLPDPKTAAKDLAVYGIAKNVPQIISSPIAGILVELGNHFSDRIGYTGFGYLAMNCIGAVFEILAVLFILFIRLEKKQPQKPVAINT